MRVLAAIFTLAVGIGGARPITAADSGKTFRISRGEKIQLRLGRKASGRSRSSHRPP
jgi:hypothetical protein